MSWYRWDDADLLLHVRVRPNARKPGIDGLHDAALCVRVGAPARENRANDALVAELAAAFDLPRRQVVLERGQSSRIKLVRVVAPAVLPAWFGELGGGPAP